MKNLGAGGGQNLTRHEDLQIHQIDPQSPQLSLPVSAATSTACFLASGLAAACGLPEPPSHVSWILPPAWGPEEKFERKEKLGQRAN